MRAHNVIIVSSGQARSAPTDALDRLIRQVVALKKNPILVLGPDGDEVLRSCSEVEHCDVVFDPNFQGGFFSGVKAGLHATHGAAFVVPLAQPAADERLAQICNELESALHETKERCDIIRPLTRNNATAVGICLVTADGVKALMSVAAETEWQSCESLSVRQVVVGQQANC